MRQGRALPAVWVLGAIPVAVLGYLALALSETTSHRCVGLVLALLAVVGMLVGALLAARPTAGLVRVSLGVSLAWFLGAVLAFATMDFASDRLLLGGVPAAVAATTATLGLRRLARR